MERKFWHGYSYCCNITMEVYDMVILCLKNWCEAMANNEWFINSPQLVNSCAQRMNYEINLLSIYRPQSPCLMKMKTLNYRKTFSHSYRILHFTQTTQQMVSSDAI